MKFTTAPDAGFEIPLDQRPADGTKAFSLREIWAGVYRSRVWIGIIMAACIGVAIAYSLLATKLYKSEVSIEVRQEAEKVLGTEADREGASSKNDTERFLQTQLEIIRSRGVAATVAESLGLYRGDAFLEAMKIEPAEKGTPNQSLQQIHREQVEQALIAHVDVEYTGNTRIAELTFVSPDPRLSARVANAYADAFIRNNLSRKADSSTYALDFLRNQLGEAQQRLERAERQALGYARRLRLVDPSNAAGSVAGTPQSLLSAQLIQLNQAYSGALSDRIGAEQKWQRTQAMPDLKIPEVLQNPAVQSLLQQRAQSAATYRQQLSTRQADYPTVLEASAQSREYDRQIATIARNIRDTVKSQYDIALSREQTLARQIEQLKSTTLDEQSQGIQLSILRREADTSRQQYDSLLRRFNSLNAEAGVQTNNLSIVDQAQISEGPSWPKLPLILALAIFIGMLLSFVCVVLREQLFDAVRIPDDVTDRLRLALLGSVPDTDDIGGEMADPKSSVSEAFNSVRTALALSEGGMPKTVLFTSSQAGEGKSSSCHALALSLARLGKTVLIIDADLRRPNAHRLFDVKNQNGLSGVLAGLLPAHEAVQSPQGNGVFLLPAGDIPPNPSELVNSPQFMKMVTELTGRYDVVLIDSAPVLGIADAVILSSEVEATVFVIEAGRNSIRGATNALARLRRGGGNLAGALLTKYNPGRLGYGYGNDYAYEYRYES
ncbi:GumC family protein [Sphingomonas mollis]|uniref:non-specific protein-tyrosine kinase n=1 Tax=Sphingomonas mollis TaxID=2795726 RepID=A0ABS0XTH9_9SPHN|nr:polysaccharide biosynthesis tyrosine autokinase [Sphingomonas sp. BT553]MBJ6123334.1 polysaccharide biosynthesis tyrosine autokinase [Sphingomonas sp. BT553]